MSQSNEIATVQQSREWAIAEASKINSLHAECCQQDGIITDSILKKANLARECGAELIEYRKNAKRDGIWEQSFMDYSSDGAFQFNSASADIYMRIARVRPEPITDIADGMAVIKEAMIATGSLFPTQGHGAQALHSFNFIGLLSKKAFDLKAAWGKQLKSEPLDTWPDSRKEAARVELEWFVEQYRALGGKA